MSYSQQDHYLKLLKDHGLVLDYQALIDKSFMVQLLPPMAAGEKYWDLIEKELHMEELMLQKDPDESEATDE
jgi:hypothetical protein